ncbi:MAG: PCI domain-containing protein [Promethearchaeota archaeon]
MPLNPKDIDALTDKVSTMIRNFSMISKEIPLQRLAQTLNLQTDEVTQLVNRATSVGKIKGTIVGYNFIWGAEEVHLAKKEPDFTKPIIFSGGGEDIGELQEDLISVEMSTGYVSGFLKVDLGVLNASGDPVEQINLKVDHGEDLRFIQVKPFQETEKKDKYTRVRLSRVEARSRKALALFFRPVLLGDYRISGSLQFVNNRNLTRVKELPEVRSVLAAPAITTTGQITAQEVESHLQQLPARAIRSYGIPHSLDGNEAVAFVHIKQLLGSLGFGLVGENDEGAGGKKVSWFHGVDTNTGTEFVAVGQVLNQKMEVFASSKDEQGIAGLLTYVSKKLKDRMLSSKIVQETSEIHELFCPLCGGTIPYYPQVGELITCKWCGGQFQFIPN